MIPQLRPYQHDVKVCIYSEWNRLGPRSNVLAVMPTGAGKTITFSCIIREFNAQGTMTAVLAHRQELVMQMSIAIARQGVEHRVIGPKSLIAAITAEHRREFGRSFVNPSAKCSVGSVQTIAARSKELAAWAAQVGLWVHDEAHHILKDNIFGKVVALFTNAFGLGVTASPRRADGEGLGRGKYNEDLKKWTNDGVFDAMVEGPTMRWLIDQKSLTDYQIVIPETDFDRDALTVTGSGEFSQKQAKEQGEKSHIVGSVVVNYCKFALGKQAIVFAIDVAEAVQMAAQLNTVGIPAAAVSAKTDDAMRQEYIRRFRAGTIRVLVNVDLFGEGFDLPAIEVVIMARPTASLAVYLQQFGRALRLMEGKAFGLIIDMVSNFKQHGFPDKPHNWSLDRRDKRGKQEPDPDEIPLTRCGNVELPCMRPYERFHRCCPHCGWTPPASAGGSVRELKQVDGDLLLLDADVLAQMRKEISLPSAAQLHAQAMYRGTGQGIADVASNRHIEKLTAHQELQDMIDLWAGHRIAAGDTVDAAYRRFFLTVGSSTLDVLHKDRSAADYRATRDMVSGWLT